MEWHRGRLLQPVVFAHGLKEFTGESTKAGQNAWLRYHDLEEWQQFLGKRKWETC